MASARTQPRQAPKGPSPRSPKQARSRETQRRLLDAAAAILDEEGLDGLSVAEVVRRAKSSVGAFYTRFGDKDALLRAVHHQRMELLLGQLKELLASGTLKGMAGRQLLELCAREMLSHYQSHPRLMAAFYARSAADPAAWSAAIEDHLRLHRIIVQLLLQGEWQNARADLEQALGLGVHMVFAYLGNVSLYRESVPGVLPFDEDALMGEVVRLLWSYAQKQTGPVETQQAGGS